MGNHVRIMSCCATVMGTMFQKPECHPGPQDFAFAKEASSVIKAFCSVMAAVSSKLILKTV